MHPGRTSNDTVARNRSSLPQELLAYLLGGTANHRVRFRTDQQQAPSVQSLVGPKPAEFKNQPERRRWTISASQEPSFQPFNHRPPGSSRLTADG